MIGRRRLRDELRRLSTSPVPVLDPVRAQQLERRVLGAVRPRELELVDAETAIPPPPGRRLAAVVTLAAACVLTVVVIASLDGAESTDRILFTSGDVEVVLPDGSVVDESSRMVVPDGSIVRLGRNGRAEVDGMTVVGAGDYLVTRDGLTLMTASDRPRSTSPPTAGRDGSPTSVAEGPAVVSRPRSSEPDPATTVGRPTTTVLGRTTTTVRGAAPPVVRPSSTAQREVPPPPDDTLEPRQALPESPATSSAPATITPQTSSEHSRNGPAPLDVTIRSDGHRVVFAWRAFAGAAGYEVAALPAVVDGESSWPPAPGVEITELHAGTLQFSVERPTAGAWTYRVAAVARDGHTLALSRVVTIES